MKTVSLTSKNQITLPAALVRRAGLRKGARFVPRLDDGMIVLEQQQDVEQAVINAQAKLRPLVSRPLSERELKQALREWS